MTVISYAQNFEDLMLLRALGAVEQGFYIDIGACAPDADSVTRLFSDRGWTGINVEPNPDYLDQLKTQRIRDVNLGVAVSDHEGEVTFHIFEETGLSTMATDVATGHAASGRPSKDLTVPVTRLRNLWRQHVPQGQEVHFLKIDVEGEEAGVIRGGDWATHRPWILVIEATAPMSQTPSHEEWEPILLENGYRFVYWDGLNRFYLADEHADLARAFQAPPNVFDDFVLYRQVLVERQAGQLVHQNETLKFELDELGSRFDEISRQLAERDQRLADEARHRDHLERLVRYFQRPLWEKALFRKTGRPTRALRRLLFHRNGKPRGMFRNWVLRPDGQPRRLFHDWLTSPEYQALPRAVPLTKMFAAGGEQAVLSPRERYFLERIGTGTPAEERD